MTQVFGFAIESLVAVLLILTIGYCALLNKRLLRLRADEQTLKATISELITATEIAERAIGGLKLTVRDCDNNLGGRLATAGEIGDRLSRQIQDGEEILRRLSRIALAAKGPSQLAPAQATAAPQSPSAQTIATAAQAIVERNRLRGVAA